MPDSRETTIACGTSSATILAEEGGVLSSFSWRGCEVLARTPWADGIAPGPRSHRDEASWVRGWRGGWQLCAPSAGQPGGGSPFFHGEASQSRWEVDAAEPSAVHLAWTASDRTISIRRTWRFLDDATIEAATTLRNDSASERPVIVAEHLILGQDLLAPLLDGRSAHLHLPPRAEPVHLDYDGRPSAALASADWRADWGLVDRGAGGRVVGLRSPTPGEISLRGLSARASVSWVGLPHVLLWQELATTVESPWESGVLAFGIEPTTTPHGAGLEGGGAHPLAPGETLEWTTRLTMTLHEEELT